jgi:hypothetical protein
VKMLEQRLQKALKELPADGWVPQHNPFVKRPIRVSRQTLVRLQQYFAAKGVWCLSILLRGKIVPGDYGKVRSLIDAGAMKIYLISPGGDLMEAMKIGRLLRDHLMSTQAPSFIRPGSVGSVLTGGGAGGWLMRPGGGDYCSGRHRECICASACFFVWTGGIERAGAAVGLHRPSFYSDYQGTASTAELQYENGINTARDYLEEMEVPARYIHLMMRTKPREIVFLGAVKLNGENINDIEGYIPSIDAWLDTYCVPVTPAERFAWSKKTIEEELCRRSVLFMPRMKAMIAGARQ